LFETDDKSIEMRGVVNECYVRIPDDGGRRTLEYVIKYESGVQEMWCLEDVDNALNAGGDLVEPIKCLEAITESPGYGCGADSRLYRDIVPIQLDPKI
jgi:hypothetical protein